MSIGSDIIEGLQNATAEAQGQPVKARRTRVELPLIDVRALREQLGMTQSEFAERFGFSVGAVRNWEQGLRRPERAARLLLAVIARDPDLVHRTLDEMESELVAVEQS